MLNRLLSRFRRPQGTSGEEETAPAVAIAGEQDAGLRLGLLPAAGFVAAALILAGVAWISHEQFSSAMATSAARIQAATGEVLAAKLAGRVQGLVDVVEAAAADPALAEALVDAPDALAARATTLAAVLPGGLRVRFLLSGQERLDEDSRPRLSYAGLELAHQAGLGGHPPLEVHLPGAEDQHVAAARAIRRDGQVIGVLLASLDVKVLQGWLKGTVPAGGYAELHQNAAGSQLQLAAAGDAGLKAGVPTGRIVVPGSAWELVYWLPVAGGASVDDAWPLLLPFAVAGLLLAGVFAALAVFTGRLVHQDLVQLVKHLFNALMRKREHGYSVRLAEFRKAARALDEQLPRLAPLRPSAHSAPAEPAPSSDVPESDVLFLRDELFSVEEVLDGERKE